jgi:nitroreductase
MAHFPCHGNPNILSQDHRDWKIIDEVAGASVKPRTEPFSCIFDSYPHNAEVVPPQKAAALIRQRRSAQDYDGRTELQRQSFFSILNRTIPRKDNPPFDACIGRVDLHLLLFVHRVSGLDKGIYLLVRNTADLLELKKICRSKFLWQKVAGAPDFLDLYLLEKGDFRDVAATASCYQDIAADSAFAVAMIAKFRENIDEDPSRYRKLHWEAGMIGQVLYLEAEAYGLRGTGIGCFLDDVAHEVLGFKDNAYQDIYHFTIGGALEDSRITTLPPYHHLNQ